MSDSVNKIKRDALLMLVNKARSDARAIENGYCRMNETKKRIMELNDSSEFSDKLDNLIENLDEAEIPWDVIEACDDIDEYIDETVIQGRNL